LKATAVVFNNELCSTFIAMSSRNLLSVHVYIGCKGKGKGYRPGVAERVGRGIALLFHDRGTRRG